MEEKEAAKQDSARGSAGQQKVGIRLLVNQKIPGFETCYVHLHVPSARRSSAKHTSVLLSGNSADFSFI